VICKEFNLYSATNLISLGPPTSPTVICVKAKGDLNMKRRAHSPLPEMTPERKRNLALTESILNQLRSVKPRDLAFDGLAFDGKGGKMYSKSSKLKTRNP